MTLNPSSLYSPSDWAELFTLCARYSDLAGDEQTFQDITDWLNEYSKVHDLPPLEEAAKWSDTRYVIKEALMFLDKFAENHTDEFEHRKRTIEEEQIVQTRRDEKNGLYPDRWDDSN